MASYWNSDYQRVNFGVILIFHVVRKNAINTQPGSLFVGQTMIRNTDCTVDHSHLGN